MVFDSAKTLLLEIDVQNDFCPGGALAVPDGDGVIAPLNTLAFSLTAAGGRVAATQDWHPADHISFAVSHSGKKAGDAVSLPNVPAQLLWPVHCVQGEWGAAFHDALDTRPVSFIIRKGFHKWLDSYSAFFENDRITQTGLDGWIRSLGIETVLIGGLALDYCVFYSAMDCVKSAVTTIIVSDAVRAVGYPAGGAEKAAAEMNTAGICFASSTELQKLF